MIVKTNDNVCSLLKIYQIEKPYKKQAKLLESQGTSYRSLRFKPVQSTKHLKDPNRHYEFTINMHYRAYCFKLDHNTIEVFHVDPHKAV